MVAPQLWRALTDEEPPQRLTACGGLHLRPYCIRAAACVSAILKDDGRTTGARLRGPTPRGSLIIIL
jgi:hypothetical protein